MDQLPVSGNLTTDSRDPRTFVTDSAAGATAWATGQKTYNGAISVDVKGKPLPILGEQAKAAGKATGLVTTAQVTDASPGRVLLADHGPGRSRTRSPASTSRRASRTSSWAAARTGGIPRAAPGAFPDRPGRGPDRGQQGHQGQPGRPRRSSSATPTSRNAEQLHAAPRPQAARSVRERGDVPAAAPRARATSTRPVVPLATMTSKALTVLARDREGFFLLIEEEGVDEFAHENNGTQDAASRWASWRPPSPSRADTSPPTRTPCWSSPATTRPAASRVEDDNASRRVRRPARPPRTALSRSRAAPAVPAGLDHRRAHRRSRPGQRRRPGSTELTGQHPNTYVHEVLVKALRH